VEKRHLPGVIEQQRRQHDPVLVLSKYVTPNGVLMPAAV
jgi:hypothetical protein